MLKSQESMTSNGDADSEEPTVERAVFASGIFSAASEHGSPPQPKSKRQRLTASEQSEFQPHESSCEDLPERSGAFQSDLSVEDSSIPPHPEAVQDKPKCRHRIHIPKNGELPTDAFYTQPPQRCSSPYRIEEFHWQKTGKPRQSEVSDSHGIMSDRTPANVTPTSHSGMLTSATALKQGKSSPLAGMDDAYEEILADLPSDAFSTPEKSPSGTVRSPFQVSSQDKDPPQDASTKGPQASRASLTNLRQTTLFGQKALESQALSVPVRQRNWPLASREEPPTHHNLDREALETWVYPTNLGSIRDYQYGIVAKGLYHNMLVALPTGLGKTFIAATVMLNWFRWTRTAQIVFVAPTKPLVSQQVKACFEVAGIPRSTTVMLTGETSPGLRAEEWTKKRVFFMTPQTLINDLRAGIADPKRIVLLVIDEAHRATGSYAYVEVVKFLNRFNTSFRVLALTATPGASVESVQAVIDGLGISRIEIRTEESLDIRQYVHPRNIDTVLFDYSDEIAMVMELFSKALQPLLDKLNGKNAYWAKDPMTLTPYGCNQASKSWMASDAGRQAHWGMKSMVMTTFSLLASLSHGTELLKYHGIGPFFHKMIAFEKESGKSARQVTESNHFTVMMTRLRAWINNPDFIGHPKLEYVQQVALNHFMDAGDGRGAADPSRTRIMIFAHYRDSAEEIARVLKRNDPMIRPHVFVGQANSKGSEGMDQKKQLSVIEKFKSGTYNTLVATSIGEEGLDIGEIDLIVCYDASASPIRMLQRMGRTGRKRAGKIVVTLMKGKEESNFIKAKDNYEKMQHEIAAGSRFTFHDESNRRIVPKGTQPVVDKKVVDIPPENTQSGLPEPSKKRKAPQRPPKKFHMPDNVRTGFLKASRLDHEVNEEDDSMTGLLAANNVEPLPKAIPPLGEVLLDADEVEELERRYLSIKGETPQPVRVPSLDKFPCLQRSLRPVGCVPHGRLTERTVTLFKSLHNRGTLRDGNYDSALHSEDRRVGVKQAKKRAAYARSTLGGYSESLLPSTPSEGIVDGISSPMVTTCHSVASMQMPGDLLTGVGSDADMEDYVEPKTFDDGKVRSPLSLPSSLAFAKEPFYVPPSKARSHDSESGEELPEFGVLVGKSAHITADAEGTVGEKNSAVPSRRRVKRRVIEDDSDDE